VGLPALTIAGRFNQVWTSIFLVAGSRPLDLVRVFVDLPSDGSEEVDGWEFERRDDDDEDEDDRKDLSWVICGMARRSTSRACLTSGCWCGNIITSADSLLLIDLTSRLTLLRILLALSFSLRNSSTTIDFSCRILMISICKCVFSSSRHRIRIARSAFVLRGHTSPDQLDALNLNLMRLRT
jgi:hypothetical protein